MSKRIRIHRCSLKGGIKSSPEFAKKGLAQFGINIGTKCGHGCTYCSTGAMLRCHPSFKAAKENPFKHGYAIIDPDIPEKVAHDAAHMRNRGLAQLCTTVDAWAPESKKYDLGRRCLEALLTQPGWAVRILTKNAAVAKDFDFIREYRDRVLVGLSLTATPDRENVMLTVEPNASPISERVAVLKQAHEMGLRTYGMLCPLLPNIADAPQHIDQLVRFCKIIGVEEVFAEAVNPRGAGLRLTEDALRAAGLAAEADAVHQVRRTENWSAYVAKLIKSIQVAMRRHGMISRLRFLLYPARLQDADRNAIEKDGEGVIWL
jgi:DNA repair photolyase